MKKVISLCAAFGLMTSIAHAAGGGGINGTIYQENTQERTVMIGVPEIGVKVPIINKDITLKTTLQSTANTVENSGQIDATIIQINDTNQSIMMSSQVNSIDNEKKLEGEVVQTNKMENVYMFGAKVNSIENK